jgi:hypothetical protein
MVKVYGLDSFHSEERPEIGCYEHSNELSGPIKCDDCLVCVSLIYKWQFCILKESFLCCLPSRFE